MLALTALVQPFSRVRASERRIEPRQVSGMAALTRPLDSDRALVWGATVRDISATGIGLKLCYPFRPGTLLNVDVLEDDGEPRSYVTRVVHAHDQPDGTWHVGCEFVEESDDVTR